jgi:Family of unknown function (DUF5321)
MRALVRSRSFASAENALTKRLVSPVSRPQCIPVRSQHTAHASEDSTRLPKLVQPSIWQSVIPRALRERATSTSQRPSNPASYFIWIYILIGSQAIRILSLKNEFRTYTRQADLKLERLREVVEKLQRGEEVDVEKLLGTGDEIAEREWEEALREIEIEERMWQNNSKRRRKQREKEESEKVEASPVNKGDSLPPGEEPTRQAMVPHGPGFY